MGNPVQTTYSFKDLLGNINSPIAGNYQLVGGNIGNGQIVIRMLTTRTEHEVGTDGTVMPSYLAGANGEATIDVQQTSALHHWLLNTYNQHILAANGGDISNWAGIAISLRTILDGSTHILSGVSFQKIPDKPYAAKGQNISWVLMAANVANQ